MTAPRRARWRGEPGWCMNCILPLMEASLVLSNAITIHRYSSIDNPARRAAGLPSRRGQQPRRDGRGVPRRAPARAGRGRAHGARDDPRPPPAGLRGDDELGDDLLRDPARPLPRHVQRPAPRASSPSPPRSATTPSTSTRVYALAGAARSSCATPTWPPARSSTWARAACGSRTSTASSSTPSATCSPRCRPTS